jgi:chromosome segregation ATPase
VPPLNSVVNRRSKWPFTAVKADDPLEAGLDILARPPGKKPQTMTLLSGGEQALTGCG